MKKDLEDLEKQGWSVQKGANGKGSYADRTTKTITIDGDRYANPESTVRTLSHEVGHAKANYVADYSSRTSYLDGTLSDEGGAALNNIKAQR